MQIVIVDTEDPRRGAIALTLRKGEHAVFEHNGATWLDNQPPHEVDVCFFHASDSGSWSRVNTVPGIDRRVFWYSGAGVRYLPANPGIGACIPRPITGTTVDGLLLLELLDSTKAVVPSGEPKIDVTLSSKLRTSLVFPAAEKSSSQRSNAVGVPRVLQTESPSVLIALAVLCEGFLIATAPQTKEKNIPKSALEKVRSKTWWVRPFEPILDTLNEMAQREWGGRPIAQPVEKLVAWIAGPDPDPPEPLDILIPCVRDALTANIT